MTAVARKGSWFVNMFRGRSFWIALVFWAGCAAAITPLSHGTLPFNRPALAGVSYRAQVYVAVFGWLYATIFMGVTYVLTRRRAIPDMGARAPNAVMSRRETVALWTYGAIVMAGGQLVGRKLFGEGIGLHLNGSLFGMTRMVMPREVWVWAIYNFILLAVVPYLVFRARGYSREALNLKSANLRNDTLVIIVVLVMETAFELLGGSKIMTLTGHQIVVGGAISFLAHLLGTGLPVMIFIYSILMPRYIRMTGSVVATTLLGAVSYAVLHLFEYWTVYDSVPHSILSIIFILLTFVSPGLVKSYLTVRTGNAWVHLWGFHAIAPHVTSDTPMIVEIFGIR
ncbi:MAG TPA: hypothetical protein VEX69_09130 [Candidatus Limnocylindria bacterium]|nr:hypothetical protein [Candidatus Limnocylindria bacterium]